MLLLKMLNLLSDALLIGVNDYSVIKALLITLQI